MKHIILTAILVVLLFGSCRVSKTTSMNASEKITAEMAYEGVSNYCHHEYDWTIAEENPSIMYVAMGDETETEYKVIFRSYTGAFVYFFVNKTNGTTRMIDSVPMFDKEIEAGTINLFDYLTEQPKASE